MSVHRIILADDHPMIREYVRNLLAPIPDLQVTGEVADGLALLQMMQHTRDFPEIILLDLTIQKMCGIEAARRIKAEHPDIKVIILTIHTEKEYLREALSAGVEGYVLKGEMNVELLTAIYVVLAGRKYVSRYFRSTKKPN